MYTSNCMGTHAYVYIKLYMHSIDAHVIHTLSFHPSQQLHSIMLPQWILWILRRASHRVQSSTLKQNILVDYMCFTLQKTKQGSDVFGWPACGRPLHGTGVGIQPLHAGRTVLDCTTVPCRRHPEATSVGHWNKAERHLAGPPARRCRWVAPAALPWAGPQALAAARLLRVSL